MKDFVLTVGNLGGGKTLELTAFALFFAEETAKAIAELKRRLETKELTEAQFNEALKHLRECYLNYPLKMDVLREDCEAEAKRLDVLQDRWGAMAARDIPNHVHYVENVYRFIAERRIAAEKEPFPDEDEGRDFFGIDEAQDLLRSRRSGDRYVKILSENADFFRKMGLEVQYQGPQQSQMDKNFRGKSTKKVLAEKFEYRDPTTGDLDDPETNIAYYYNKYTVFDTSQVEKRKSATFFMPYAEAKKVHRYYGSNVFTSKSLTTKHTLQEFLEENPEATEEEEAVEEDSGSSAELLIAVAKQVEIITDALSKNPFFTMTPKEARALYKGLMEFVRGK